MKDRFKHAENGSFVVTENNKNYSILIFDHIEDNILYLHEVNLPVSSIPKNERKSYSWKNKIQNNELPATSWLVFGFNLDDDSLLFCYSHTKECFINLENQSVFFSELIKLELNEVPPLNRKRIGPKPGEVDFDTRKIWNPPVIINQEKVPGATTTAFKGTWPNNSSELSGKELLLYFDEKKESFPFPYWLEVGDEHHHLRVKVLNSGIGLKSPLPIPSLPLTIQSNVSEKCIDLLINKDPMSLKLFAVTLDPKIRHTVPLKFSSRKVSTALFEISICNDYLREELQSKGITLPSLFSLIFFDEKTKETTEASHTFSLKPIH